MPKQKSSVDGTPRKPSGLSRLLNDTTPNSSSGRVLRPRASPSILFERMTLSSLEAANIPLINQNSKVSTPKKAASSSTWSNRKQHQLNLLNTNTNNPDDSNLTHKPSLLSSLTSSSTTEDYDDEDEELLTTDNNTVRSSSPTITENNKDLFGTNNANSAKIQKERQKNRWYQKNMFGLPSEDSDNGGILSDAKSSDEETFDISPVKQLKKGFIKSSNKENSSSRNSSSINYSNQFSNIICSPAAAIIYIWQTIISSITIINSFLHTMSRKSLNVKYWYLVPFALPMILSKNSLNYVVYLFDRLFKTSNYRRLLSLSSKQSNKTWLRYMLNLLWLIFWIILTFYLLTKLSNQYHTYSEYSTRFSDNLDRPKRFYNSIYDKIKVGVESIFSYIYNIPDQSCMNQGGKCIDVYDCTVRWSFCMFSYPARWIVNHTMYWFEQSPVEFMQENILQNEDTTKPMSNNLSAIYDMINKIQMKLKQQDVELQNYKKQINTISKTDGKINAIVKALDETNNKILQINQEINELKLLKTTFELKAQQIVQNSIASNNNEFEGKLTTIKSQLQQEINQIIQSKSNNFKKNLEKLAVKVTDIHNYFKTELNGMSAELNEMKLRTKSLEENKDFFVQETKMLKKEILDDLDEKLKKIYKEHLQLKSDTNEELSQLEQDLNNKMSEIISNSSSSSSSVSATIDDATLKMLIQNHLDNLKGNIREEINQTLWDKIQENIRSEMDSIKTNFDNQANSNVILNEKSECQCPLSACRCRASSTIFGGSRCMRLHQVRQLVHQALQIYSADKIGRADYALETAGGTVASTRCTETFTGRAATLTVLGIPVLKMTNSPRIIIQPSLNPGECWAIKGSHGNVVIQLSGLVEVNSVTIDHIPKSLSPSGSIDSAIKDFEVKALENEKDEIGRSLGNFTYEISGDPIQTFYISNPTKTNFVEFSINSNHGNKEYSCIYRVRVHGKLIDHI